MFLVLELDVSSICFSFTNIYAEINVVRYEDYLTLEQSVHRQDISSVAEFYYYINL